MKLSPLITHARRKLGRELSLVPGPRVLRSPKDALRVPHAAVLAQEARQALGGRYVLMESVVPMGAPIHFEVPGLSEVDRAWLHRLRPLAGMAFLATLAPELREEAFDAWSGGLLEYSDTCGPGHDEAYALEALAHKLPWLLFARDVFEPELARSPNKARVVDALIVDHVEWLALQPDQRGLLGWVQGRALVWSGFSVAGAEAGSLIERGRALVAATLAQLVADDGGTRARSSLQHLEVLAQLLELLALAPSGFGVRTSRLRATALDMCDWLVTTTHPSGRPLLLGEASLGVAPEPRTLLALAKENLGHLADQLPRDVLLGASGLAAVQRPCSSLLASVGSRGAGHADALSFEWSIPGNRDTVPLIVEGGSSTLAPGALLDYERGPKAHNTVAWLGPFGDATFLAARSHRTIWFPSRYGTSGAFVDGGGKHFVRLGADLATPAFSQRRRWFYSPGHWLIVADVVRPSRPGALRARSHLHYAWSASDTGAHLVLSRDGAANVRVWSLMGGPPTVLCGVVEPREGFVAERLGEPLPSPTLIWTVPHAPTALFAVLYVIDPALQVAVAHTPGEPSVAVFLGDDAFRLDAGARGFQLRGPTTPLRGEEGQT